MADRSACVCVSTETPRLHYEQIAADFLSAIHPCASLLLKLPGNMKRLDSKQLNSEEQEPVK
jgi:hypothetical protein